MNPRLADTTQGIVQMTNDQRLLEDGVFLTS